MLRAFPRFWTVVLLVFATALVAQETLLDQAAAALARGNPAEAEHCATAALAASPSDLRGLLLMGLKYVWIVLAVLLVFVAYESLLAASAVVAAAALIWILGKRVLTWRWVKTAIAHEFATKAQFYLREKNQLYLDSGKA